MNMPFEMVHADQRFAERKRQGFAVNQSHKQRPDQARSLSYGDGVYLIQANFRPAASFLYHGRDLPQVFAAGNFRHDAPILFMRHHLGGNDRGEDALAVFHYSGGGFVATGFEAKHEHLSSAPVSYVSILNELPWRASNDTACRKALSQRQAYDCEVNMEIRKAVLPVAGLGTRFLPATKAQPKEMLPIVDKPLVQYAVEELANSGISMAIFVTGRGKDAIEDHFDFAPELEEMLKGRGKEQMLDVVRSVSSLLQMTYVRQKSPLGLGHAILVARDLVGEEPFAVVLSDDIIDAPVPCVKQMMDVFARYGRSVVAIQRVERKATSSYGIIKGHPVVDHNWDGRLFRITDMVEKTEPRKAPS